MRGGEEGKPPEAVGVERWSAVEKIHGTGRETTDQGGAGEKREPGGAVRPRNSSETEDERSQGRDDRLMGRGGAKGSEADPKDPLA